MSVWMLVLVAVVVAGNPSEEYLDILPSDVPVTMMERLTNEEGVSKGEDVDLVTPLGVVTGRKEVSLGDLPVNPHHYSFRGIPYASPPVADLRWRDPVDRRGPWPDGHLDATKFRPFCLQFDTETKRVLGSEDCLYLNVYTPRLPGNSSQDSQLLPVLVFFHGGAFLRGSSSAHGPARLLSHDLVLVTPNYRLGALGFASTGDAAMAGNYGMLDQVSALRWVRDNVAHFGGDPDRVTIGGFSAGSASVHLHMASPLSRGLFHGGIMMSGSGNLPWVVRQDTTSFTHQLAAALDCPTHPSPALKDCLLQVPTENLLKAQADLHRYGFWPLPFVPRVDGGLRLEPFLPQAVPQLPLAPVPVLMGGVPDEGLMFAAGVIILATNASTPKALYDEAVPYVFCSWPEDPDFLPVLQDVMEGFYFTPRAPSSFDAIVEDMSEALTDYFFHHGVWDDAAALTKGGITVYTYLNTHRDPDTPTWATPLYNRLREMGVTTPVLDTGVSHGDDMVMLFDFPYALGKFSSRDQQVSALVTGAWANFVQTGAPNNGPASLSWAHLDTWVPLDPSHPEGFFHISPDPSMVLQPYKPKQRNMWRRVVQRVRHVTVAGTALEACPAVPRKD